MGYSRHSRRDRDRDRGRGRDRGRDRPAFLSSRFQENCSSDFLQIRTHDKGYQVLELINFWAAILFSGGHFEGFSINLVIAILGKPLIGFSPNSHT